MLELFRQMEFKVAVSAGLNIIFLKAQHLNYKELMIHQLFEFTVLYFKKNPLWYNLYYKI